VRSSGDVCVRWLMLIAFGGLIFVLSSRPLPAEYVPPIPHFDKLAHCVAYGLLAMLCFRAFWLKTGRSAPIWVLLLGASVATAYGALEEFHQIFVPTREFSWLDMIADGVGAALAAALWEPLTHKYAWLN